MRAPEGWTQVALGDIAWEVSKRNQENLAIPVLSVTKHAGFVPSDEYFSRAVYSKNTENYKVVRKGQFAYATIHLDEGSIDVLKTHEAGMVSPMYTVFDVLDHRVDRIFLFILLKFLASKGKFDALGNGGVNRRKSISFKNLSAFTFYLPPLQEQRTIADALLSIDSTIESAQAVIEQTRTVKQGVFSRLLTKGIGHTRFKRTDIGEIPEGWEIKSLGDVCERVTSGSRGWAEFYSDTGSLFLRSQNIRSGRLNLEDQKFVNVPAGAEGSRTLIKPDDLLFTITGNNVGNVAKAPHNLGDAYISQHISLVRLRERKFADILMAFFSPDGPGNVQLVNSQYGQSKPGLNLDNIKNLKIPFPTSGEIGKITDIISALSNIEATIQKEIEMTLSLKSALLSDLLTGRKRFPAALLATAD